MSIQHWHTSGGMSEAAVKTSWPQFRQRHFRGARAGLDAAGASTANWRLSASAKELSAN